MIRVEDLSFHYGHTRVLDDISLNIPKQGITALVGANGSGKSTLLSLIARLMPLQSGTIHVGDLDVANGPSDQLARHLSILPQSAEIAPRLTVRELAGFGRYPYHKGRPGPEDHARINAALEVFDLLPIADRVIDTLSGGQRQRAHVAMTYAQDTEYMLLDEPLNNLDIAASRSLMQTLRHLAETEGRTIVIVLHDLNFACAYADHVVALSDGKIAAEGPPAEIVTDAFLSSVFATDAKVHYVDAIPLIVV